MVPTGGCPAHAGLIWQTSMAFCKAASIMKVCTGGCELSITLFSASAQQRLHIQDMQGGHVQEGLHLLIANQRGQVLLDPPQPCFCAAAGLKHSAAYVQGLVDKEIAAGIPASRVVLAGFSQGGHLALKTALFSPQRLAGCVALSTWLEPLKNQVTGCSKPCLCGCARSPGCCVSQQRHQLQEKTALWWQ